MPEQPQDPHAVDEPRTEPRTLESTGMRARPSHETPDETPRLRRIAFWGVIALVLVAGVALYFLYADAVFPVLRTDN